MHSNPRRLKANKASVKPATQTTISRFFISAGEKAAAVDEARINCTGQAKLNRGKVINTLFTPLTLSEQVLGHFSHVYTLLYNVISGSRGVLEPTPAVSGSRANTSTP